MRSKLYAIAQTFVREVGDELQHYTFVFPNHRSGLFFRKYLSQYIEQPLFAPRVSSVNECFAEFSSACAFSVLCLFLTDRTCSFRSKSRKRERPPCTNHCFPLAEPASIVGFFRGNCPLEPPFPLPFFKTAVVNIPLFPAKCPTFRLFFHCLQVVCIFMHNIHR